MCVQKHIFSCRPQTYHSDLTHGLKLSEPLEYLKVSCRKTAQKGIETNYGETHHNVFVTHLFFPPISVFYCECATSLFYFTISLFMCW